MNMHNAAPLYGLLLAGGRSSRMGENKANLTLAGQTLLARGQSLLREAGCQQVVVSGDYGLSNSLPDAPAWQGCGPLAGIASALQRYPDVSWLVLPVDMPAMEGAVLARLTTQLSTLGGAGGYTPGSQFPLLLQASPGLLPQLVAQLAQAEPRARSIGGLIHALALLPLAAAALESDALAWALLNTNTPQEWQQFLAQRSKLEQAARRDLSDSE